MKIKADNNINIWVLIPTFVIDFSEKEALFTWFCFGIKIEF